ncbi:MAG: S41 family peptidase [Prevotellaceae bacterium]|jgi:carboxyl-terminal processing protease|nr:S41 family peptidase [Prevotellaceae bacterium]
MDNKKINYLRPVLALAMVILALYTGIRLGKMSTPAKIYKSWDGDRNNLLQTLDIVSKFYVDNVNIDSLTEKFIPDILNELDPHSTYIPASELQRSNESLEGNFEGIGVTFNMEIDTAVIINVLTGGPSAKAGVSAGDKIMVVNDTVIAGKKIAQEEIVKLLRGKSGSKVNIKVQREGVDELIPIEITRGNIPIKSIDASYMITPSTGYVIMSRFAKTTYSDFVAAVNELHEKGMKNMILDLRGNTGGFLEQVIAVTGELFPDRRLIVYTEGRAFPRQNQYSDGDGKCGNDKIAILINEQSASASEILAGAVQDNDRGTIIGQRSFGKGLVQQMRELADKSGLRLTIARYYTPSGRSIQRPYGHGISGVRDYYREFDRRYENGELVSADSIKQTDTTKYYTTEGRTVYGGGGITPDIFVPSERYDSLFTEISRRNLFFKYSISFCNRHRIDLNAIDSIEQLEQFFAANSPYDGLYSYLKNAKIDCTLNDINKSKEFVENVLKAYAGRTTNLGELAAFFYLNKTDKTVQKAVETLEADSDSKTPDNNN